MYNKELLVFSQFPSFLLVGQWQITTTSLYKPGSFHWVRLIDVNTALYLHGNICHRWPIPPACDVTGEALNSSFTSARSTFISLRYVPVIIFTLISFIWSRFIFFHGIHHGITTDLTPVWESKRPVSNHSQSTGLFPFFARKGKLQCLTCTCFLK